NIIRTKEQFLGLCFSFHSDQLHPKRNMPKKMKIGICLPHTESVAMVKTDALAHGTSIKSHDALQLRRHSVLIA
ncbi:hypothetical protein J6590_091361, partial [Homalodisca vitripennis]